MINNALEHRVPRLLTLRHVEQSAVLFPSYFACKRLVSIFVPVHGAGLIQSPSHERLPGLSTLAEVGGIASSLCPKALLPQPISI